MAKTARKPPPKGGKAGAADLSADMRLVVLHGKETFLQQGLTRKLIDVLEGEFGEVEIFKFDGAAAELADVLDELRSYGLLQTHKLVILDSAEEFLAKNEGVYREPMERYAASPVEHATLLMRAAGTWRAGKIDKSIKNFGTIIKCDEAKEPEAVAFCVRQAEDTHGVQMEQAAAALLVERQGVSLTRLDTEVAKLASVSKGERITVDLVREMVGRSREEQAWEIQQAILSGPGPAMQKLRELIDVSQAPAELLIWSMTDLMKRLHGTSRLLSEGVPVGTVMKQMKLWGPARDPMLDAARRHHPHTHAQLLQICIDADRRRKAGLASEASTLETLAVTLADRLK